MLSPKTKKKTLKPSNSAAMMVQPKCLVVDIIYFQCSFYPYTHVSEIPNAAPLVYRTQTRRLFSDIFYGAKMNDFSNVI
jgi:hypothetical protein